MGHHTHDSVACAHPIQFGFREFISLSKQPSHIFASLLFILSCFVLSVTFMVCLMRTPQFPDVFCANSFRNIYYTITQKFKHLDVSLILILGCGRFTYLNTWVWPSAFNLYSLFLLDPQSGSDLVSVLSLLTLCLCLSDVFVCAPLRVSCEWGRVYRLWFAHSDESLRLVLYMYHPPRLQLFAFLFSFACLSVQYYQFRKEKAA